MAGTIKNDGTAPDLIRTVSRHSLAYLLCAASEMFRHYDFDPLDLMIIHAVLNANVLNVMKNPELDRRFGSIEAVEPDEIKQGVWHADRNRPPPRRSIEEERHFPGDRPGTARHRGQSIQMRQ
jgi:hypothetical protein